MKATERVWRTLDGRYVGEGHFDAAFLAAAVGDELPADFKMVDTPPNKAVKSAPNKAAKAA
jgi:hypothetical protein